MNKADILIKVLELVKKSELEDRITGLEIVYNEQDYKAIKDNKTYCEVKVHFDSGKTKFVIVKQHLEVVFDEDEIYPF